MKDQINTIREALEAAHDDSLDGHEFRCRQTLMSQIVALAQLEAMAERPFAYCFLNEHGEPAGYIPAKLQTEASKEIWPIPLYRAAPVAQQPQARPDFTDEWTGYLKDGETPFERFLRERKDMQSVLKLYQRVLEENERLKAQQPQAEKRCQYCDGTGDVHSIDGQWRGECHCQKQPQAEAVPNTLQKAEAHLLNLIGEYWGLAYAEGAEGRTHDTEDGAAQRTHAAIAKAVKDLIAASSTPQQAEAVPSSDLNPDEGDPVTLWAEIWRLREAVKGPDGYATWQDAATAERIRRVRAESKQAEVTKTVATHDDTDLIEQMLEALRSCSGVPHWPALIPTINAARKRLETPQQAEAVPQVEAAEVFHCKACGCAMQMPHDDCLSCERGEAKQAEAVPPDVVRDAAPIPDHELVTMYDERPTSDLEMIEFAREVERRHGIGVQPQHITDGSPCWCNPDVAYTDPETSASVIVHRRPQ